MAVGEDVELKAGREVLQAHAGKRATLRPADVQEIKVVPGFRSKPVDEFKSDVPVERGGVRDNQLTEVGGIRAVDRDDQPPVGRLLIVAENGQRVG